MRRPKNHPDTSHLIIPPLGSSRVGWRPVVMAVEQAPIGERGQKDAGKNN